MYRKVTMCLLVILAVTMLAVSANAFSVRLSGFPGITQENCSTYCGAASCKMCASWINSCSASQTTIYNYCHSNNRENWYIDPQGLSYGLWNWTPSSPIHVYGHWHYTYNTGRIRGVCWTIENYNEGVPVVIRAGAHFVVVRGFDSTMSVKNNYTYNSGTLVNGVYINDPLYSSCGGYIGGWDSYVSASTFATSYFTNVNASGSHWNGKAASVERDANTQNACRTNGDNFNYY